MNCLCACIILADFVWGSPAPPFSAPTTQCCRMREAIHFFSQANVPWIMYVLDSLASVPLIFLLRPTGFFALHVCCLARVPDSSVYVRRWTRPTAEQGKKWASARSSKHSFNCLHMIYWFIKGSIASGPLETRSIPIWTRYKVNTPSSLCVWERERKCLLEIQLCLQRPRAIEKNRARIIHNSMTEDWKRWKRLKKKSLTKPALSFASCFPALSFASCSPLK